jgi:uncharacterized protein (TIGR03437 family)
VAAGAGGVLYGSSEYGGSGPCTELGSGCGTIFSLTPPLSPGGAWTEAVLYSFTGAGDGGQPSSVVIGSGGVLYGTTQFGGTGACSSAPTAGCGTVFSLTPPASPGGVWTERVIYSFMSGKDGSVPTSGVTIGSGGALYGTTQWGGSGPCSGAVGFPGCGTVFSLTPPVSSGGAWTEAVLYNFPSFFGYSPPGVAIGSGGILYGTTATGGTGSACSCGAVFSLTPPTGGISGPGAPWTEATLYSFAGGSDGNNPAGVVIGSGGVLYGASGGGGVSSSGTVFALAPPGLPGGAWIKSVLYAFTTGLGDNGYYPSPGLTIGSGGVIYGTTSSGGASDVGTVFSLTPPPGEPLGAGAWTESVIYNFTSGTPGVLQTFSGLAIGQGGAIYGATAYGGPAASGTVYALNPPTSSSGAWTESPLYSFTGASPGNGELSGLAVGVGPGGGPVLYGTTEGGGTGACPAGCGTVFSLTPPAEGPSAAGPWTLSVLYRFRGGSDGAYPAAGVTIGSGGLLYGTTEFGGTGPCTAYGQPPGCGVVFSLDPPASPGGAWTETTLHSFYIPNATCPLQPFEVCTGNLDGAYPVTGLAIGGGVLYGTTSGGGTLNSGTAFSLTPPTVPGGGWTETVLYNFASHAEAAPTSAGPSALAIGSGPGGSPVLYGTTSAGSLSSQCGFLCGTVFSLTPPAGLSGAGGAWTETALYSSTCCNTTPLATAGVAIGGGGVLYGTIPLNEGQPNSAIAFSLTPPTSSGGEWTEAVLYNFNGFGDSGSPSGVAIGSGGVLYGTAQYGGSGPCIAYEVTGCGKVFELIPPVPPDPGWTEATLYSFTGGGDGAYPLTGVATGSGGVLYGTTGGTANTGTVFALQVGAIATPSINLGGVVNAASYTAPVAPGSIASVFGNFLLSLPLGAVESPLPDSISGLSLQFGGGTEAPLFFVSGGQVNFQVPWELSGQSQATLAATLDYAAGAAQTVNLAPVAPAIFSTNAAGTEQGAILDTSYRLVDSTNPAAAGSFVLIYCTGLGVVGNQPATGSPAPSDPLAMSATPLVTIGGATANVQFSGLAPGYVGLYQVNAQVPAGSATGPAVPVTISIGGVTSNMVTLAVQ